mgnify:CR=1 FL=1
MTNDWKARLGMVYSTDPNFKYDTEEAPQTETLAPERQDLRVWLDRKQRGGKTVTLVKGFVGSDTDLGELARLLKTRCGVGGAAKDGGNHHPGRPPRPGGRNPHQSGLQMQKGRRMTRPAPMRRFAAILFLLGFLFIGGKSVRAQYYSWVRMRLRCVGNTCAPRTYGSSFPTQHRRWRTEPCIIFRRYAPRLHTVSATRR